MSEFDNSKVHIWKLQNPQMFYCELMN